jgi:hypothetical protein
MLVPHSQCSLWKNPKFWKKFKCKNYTLKENFWLIFLFVVCYCNSGLAFKGKNFYIASQNCMHFIKENSQNLRQRYKWALWMRHLNPRSLRTCFSVNKSLKMISSSFLWSSIYQTEVVLCTSCFSLYNTYMISITWRLDYQKQSKYETWPIDK